MPVKILPLPDLETLYDSMISIGGGVFRGVQKGFRDGNGKPVEPLILFDDASIGSHGSTLALPASQISMFAVIAALREKRKQFESRMFQRDAA